MNHDYPCTVPFAGGPPDVDMINGKPAPPIFYLPPLQRQVAVLIGAAKSFREADETDGIPISGSENIKTHLNNLMYDNYITKKIRNRLFKLWRNGAVTIYSYGYYNKSTQNFNYYSQDHQDSDPNKHSPKWIPRDG